MDYKSEIVVYQGPFLSRAAEALSPGTVFGKGATIEEAYRRARARSAHARTATGHKGKLRDTLPNTRLQIE